MPIIFRGRHLNGLDMVSILGYRVCMETVSYPKCKCRKCGFQWISRSEDLPIRCANPKCRSPYWQNSPCVYVIERAPGQYKIGCTSNLKQRHQVKKMHGFVAVIPCLQGVGQYELEEAIHSMFARRGAELFALTDSDIELLKRLQKSSDPLADAIAAGATAPKQRTGTSYACLRCGYNWPQRTNRTPRSCPRCKSYEWQRPLLADSKGGSSDEIPSER